jgi:formamidase
LDESGACRPPACRLLQVYFPVFVEGANLSMGDMHFSQGDGEVSFCGAIEMTGFLELK